MKVALNATCLNERPSGAKQRFVGIYSALFRLLPEVEFVIFDPQDCKVSGWFADYPNVCGRTTTIPSTGKWDKLASALSYWSSCRRSEKFDIFEVMHLPLFQTSQEKTILTIHDVRDLYPEHATMNRFVYSAVLRRALKCADRVVTVSETMRSEIIKFSGHDQVSVVYNGIDLKRFCVISEVDCIDLKKRLTLPQEFVLAVGHLEKRKNYSKLIDSLSLLKQRGVSVPLVIVGNDSGEGRALSQQVANLNLGSQVRFLSGLSDREVRALYFLSHALVFPSSYEGFGIPVLEAMAVGKPLLLSDLPVFREITENQAVYFSSGDVSDIACVLETGLGSSSYSSHMREYGLKRVLDFSFDGLAKSVVDMYSALG